MSSIFNRSISAEEALKKVKDNINLVRQASNKNDAQKLAKISKKRVNIAAARTDILNQLDTAYREHARVLNEIGLSVQAKSCIEKADAIFLHLSSPVTLSVTTSTATTNQPALHVTSGSTTSSHNIAAARMFTGISGAVHSASTVNISTAQSDAAMSVSTLYFDKNINFATIGCIFPAPNEHLQNTFQLIVCLALLQATCLEKDKLGMEAKYWLESTSVNDKEKKRLEALASEIGFAFKFDKYRDSKVVIREAVPLAFVFNVSDARLLRTAIVGDIGQSSLLNVDSLEELALLIQGSPSGSIDLDEMVQILKLLNSYNRRTPAGSALHYQLVVAISHILDVMTDSTVYGVGQLNLHELVSVYLQELKASKDSYLVFQAAYAHQALAHVHEVETRSEAELRRCVAVLRGVAGVSNAVKSADLRGINNSISRIDNGLTGATETALTKSLPEISSLEDGGSGLLKALEEGVSFKQKRSWYRALRLAGTLLQLGELIQFKALVSEVCCRNDIAFQWGIVQHLGNFAADSRTTTLAHRNGAVLFLGDLYRDHFWISTLLVKQLILDILLHLIIGNGDISKGAQSTFNGLKNFGNRSLQMLYLDRINIGPTKHPWSNFQLTSLTKSPRGEARLLKVAQSRISINAMPASSVMPSENRNSLSNTLPHVPAGASSSSVITDSNTLQTGATTQQTLSEVFSENITHSLTKHTLPKASRQITSTPQLLYCLSLIHPSMISKEKLSQSECDWIQARQVDLDEQERLQSMATDLIRAFVREELKNTSVVSEIVSLAAVLRQDDFRKLLQAFVDGISQSILLDVHLLSGLAQLIRNATPGYIDTDDFNKILDLLSTRLKDTHQQSTQHTYRLALTIAQVLDSMVDSQVEGLSREQLHEPLSDYLKGLQDSSDLGLIYQALYAYQALLYIPDDETILQSMMRRTGKLVLGISGVVVAVKALDIGGFIAGLQRIHEGLAGADNVIRHFGHTYSNLTKFKEKGQGLLAGLKEGFNFKHRSSWYPALRGLDRLVQDGQFVEFEKLIREAPCKHHPAFQWGVCQRLGEIAANTMWDIKIRKSAVIFLMQLYKDNAAEGQQDAIILWILNILNQLASSSKEVLSDSALELLKEPLINNSSSKKGGDKDVTVLHPILITNSRRNPYSSAMSKTSPMSLLHYAN